MEMVLQLLLPFILVFLSLQSFTLSLNQEGLYLQRVKLGISDPNNILSDWNDDGDETPCNWTGITCELATLSVTSVVLSNSGIAGPFPVFLCRLPSLSTISLSNNSINSSLPATISDCRNLTHLDLSQNFLVGPIPGTLSDIPGLVYLNLDGNSLSGDIPATFGAFRRLVTLILTSNLLNGTISSVLGNITSLKSLQLAYNPFSPSNLPPEFGGLLNLEYLWLSACNLVGEIPASFGNLGKLTNLDVSNNGLKGRIPGLIFNLTSVVQIELYNNSFAGEIPSGWSKLPALRRFDASINRLIGTIPDDLCNLPLESLNLCDNKLEGLLPESISLSPNLYELKAFNNRLKGPLPSELGKYSPLKTLDLSQNQFSGEIPASLCEKGALEELLLIHNSFSGNIPESLGKCRSLRRFRLRANRLSGEVPGEIWGLPHVYLLDLGENLLSGRISSMISGASNLSTLFISKNQFSGSIPKEIGFLENLIEISGSDNGFTGQIPSSFVHLNQLGRLDLSNNDLSGEIQFGIQSWKQLNELNLANNMISGEIPAEIGSLVGLNYLDLSGNHFSGRIPLELQNLKLNRLNLSDNRLSGDIPPIYAKEIYRDSFVGNPGLCGDIAGLCPQNGVVKNQSYLWILRLTYVVAAIVLVVGVVWFLWKYLNFKKTQQKITISKWRSFHKLGFSEHEIHGCLDEDNVIGSGASGKVYKAVLSNGEVVAVKRLWERSKVDKIGIVASMDPERDAFEMEVETLGKIRHKNIVRLWCCCNSGDCKLLVYEYMPNGSLGDLLRSSKAGLLDWPRRIRIAIDAAEGLSYLHNDCVPPIVHRDVKSNNILLDVDFGARIADFGVAKIVQAVNKGGECMSAIAGSCGYIAPEYAYTLRVNEKSDIYSFGVVLLELVTGRQPIDPEFREKDLVSWVCNSLDKNGVDQVIDPRLDNTFKEQICRVLDIGLLCTSPLPINRPSMRRVVKLLQKVSEGDKIKNSEKDGKLSPYYYDDTSDQGSLA